MVDLQVASDAMSAHIDSCAECRRLLMAFFTEKPYAEDVELCPVGLPLHGARREALRYAAQHDPQALSEYVQNVMTKAKLFGGSS